MVTTVDEIQRLGDDIIERLEERVPEASRRGFSAVDPRLEPVRPRPIEDHVGVGVAIEDLQVEGVAIRAVERLVRPARYLDVLLRHQLPPPSGPREPVQRAAETPPARYESGVVLLDPPSRLAHLQDIEPGVSRSGEPCGSR